MPQNTNRGAFARVLSFAASRWARRPGRLSAVVVLQVVSTGADVSIPILTGQLVASVAESGSPWGAFVGLLALGVLSIGTKVASYFAIIDLTIPTMKEVEAEAFARVQRLPASWHANAFAGSTVRKITRGAWALDDMGDLLMLALGPSVLVLIGTIATLSAFRVEVGLVALLGAVLFVTVSLVLTLRWVAPAARLANAQDSRVSGALADAITSNAVVKAHAAEAREDARLDRVLDKWAHRSRRTWRRGTWSGLVQDTCLWVLRALVLGGALLAFVRGAAGAGEIAFAVSALGMLDGYLRQIGNHVRNLQKAVNDAEEMVELMEDGEETDVARPRRAACRLAPQHFLSTTWDMATKAHRRRSSLICMLSSQRDKRWVSWGGQGLARPHSSSLSNACMR